MKARSSSGCWSCAGQLDLEDRVQFVGRIDDRELIDHLARCRAVVFPPFNEDYGFVTVEAFMCGKPVITCTRQRRARRSWCATARTASSPIRRRKRSRARCARVMDDRNLAQRLGEAGHAMASQMTWSKAIQQLLR